MTHDFIAIAKLQYAASFWFITIPLSLTLCLQRKMVAFGKKLKERKIVEWQGYVWYIKCGSIALFMCSSPGVTNRDRHLWCLITIACWDLKLHNLFLDGCYITCLTFIIVAQSTVPFPPWDVKYWNFFSTVATSFHIHLNSRKIFMMHASSCQTFNYNCRFQHESVVSCT